MVTVFHYTPVNTKQFDGLNIDGLAGKHQKRQNFSVKILRYTVCEILTFSTVSHSTVYYIVYQSKCCTNTVYNCN